MIRIHYDVDAFRDRYGARCAVVQNLAGTVGETPLEPAGGGRVAQEFDYDEDQKASCVLPALRLVLDEFDGGPIARIELDDGSRPMAIEVASYLELRRVSSAGEPRFGRGEHVVLTYSPARDLAAPAFAVSYQPMAPHWPGRDLVNVTFDAENGEISFDVRDTATLGPGVFHTAHVEPTGTDPVVECEGADFCHVDPPQTLHGRLALEIVQGL
jgi:hypothetical protein